MCGSGRSVSIRIPVSLCGLNLGKIPIYVCMWCAYMVVVKKTLIWEGPAEFARSLFTAIRVHIYIYYICTYIQYICICIYTYIHRYTYTYKYIIHAVYMQCL